MNRTARTVAAAATLALTLGLSACGLGSTTAASSSAPAADAPHVAFLVPSTSLRSQAYDVPNFTVALHARCPECVVDVQTAADQATQNTQGEKAVQDGAAAVVVVAIDGSQAGALVSAAKAADVPVVAYDRLIKDVPLSYYVSFDGDAVGKLGGTAILDAIGSDTSGGAIVMLEGDPADNNAGLFAKGAHSVLDGKVEIADERYVAGWSSAQAEVEMTQALASLHGRRLLGVYTAYDGLAAGALQALAKAGYSGVPITGQDAETAALQRILSGAQTMTVYKDLPGQARATATLVADVLEGKTPATTGTTDNGNGAVPTVLLKPQAVGKAEVATKVLKDGYTTVDALCAGAASTACAQAGITS
ncbi:sugar ABC transporter substrate-binding protein [Kineococcus rhizosphaerae]|uniref:D-xylose transport system substrate-binding protein n=1 Tax=Kineococcus rhizosphaerae TaxID=559628 RepID=A0A2T0QYU6_9ACTN|nr:substrate-binding domain-containing protein [Kineococcus rhizosphaerae]PRY11541.1 D-xylose transport system substrate-binding protein [Kineococcus rhizosphaerae]